MFVPKDFMILPDDLYRLAVSSSPKMTHVRPVDDVDLYDQNGVLMILANNRGVSLWTLEGVKIAQLTGWAWRIRKNTPLPPKLKLHNDQPEHYVICPTESMPLSTYIGLLETLVVHCEKVFKIKKPGELP